MQHWKLQVIIYVRDDRFEAEAINAGIVGVGTTPLDAMRDFEQMATTLALHADKAGSRLTYEPDKGDSALFSALQNGTLGGNEVTAKGIVGIGTLGLGLQRVNSDNRARLESAHLNLDLVGGAA